MTEGESVTFSVVASDSDNDSLSFFWFLDGNDAGQPGTSFIWTAPTGASGAHTLIVLISDGRGGSAFTRWEIFVEARTVPSIAVTSVVLKGTVEDQNATVRVDGVQVPNIGGYWQQEVAVTGDSRTVTVEAADGVGNATVRTVTITVKDSLN
jgi:hypothetical protein